MRNRWVFAGVATLVLLFASGVRGDERIKWSPIDYSRFNIDAEVGLLASCAYKLLDAGKSSSFSYAVKDRVKVEAKKDKEKRLRVYVYVNVKLPRVKAEWVKDAASQAVEECYSIASE